MEDTKKRSRDGSLDNFVMWRVGFVLNDMRYKRLSDAAVRIYMYLTASVIAFRREILPPEVAAESIAWDLHKDVEVIVCGLEELGLGPRPLVKVRDDGRIQVVGQRKIAGNRFKWCYEPELETATTTVNDSDTIVQRSLHDDGMSLHDPTTTSQDVEEEKEGDRERDVEGRSSDDRYTILAEATSGWSDKGQTEHKLWVMQRPRLFDHTEDVIAVALWMNDWHTPPIRPWRVLRQHLEDGKRPDGKTWRRYVQKAKELLQKQAKPSENALIPTGKRGGEPASIQSIIPGNNGSQG